MDLKTGGRDGRAPIDLGPWPGGEPAWLSRALWAFVGLGMALRLLRYALDFPLWGDEAFVAVNFIARGYRALLDPLDYGQICPPLFLWAERTAVLLFGFNEWSLRLVPMLCGLACVPLFVRMASRVVRGVPLLLAVGIFMVSFQPVRHAAEAKPYAGDLLASLLLLTLALEWWRAPVRVGWLWALAGVVPLTLGLSHPAVFVSGGIGLGMARAVWRTGNRRTWMAFAVYLAAQVATFAFLMFAVTGAQSQGASLRGLRGYWANSFPPLDNPIALARWLVLTNTGAMSAYPGGGRDGQSTLTVACVLVGAVVLWRRGRRAIVATCAGPFALALLAAALRRYPYGGESRQMQFVAPILCLLAGIGLAVALRRVARPAALAGAVALLFWIGIALGVKDVARPFRFEFDVQARDFARRFWPAQDRAAELLCLRGDLGIAQRGQNLRTAVYLCNQWIYAPNRRRPGGLRREAISAARPLHCILYHETSPDFPPVVALLSQLGAWYELRRVIPVDVDTSGARAGPKVEHLRVYEFVPRVQPIARAGTVRPKG